MPMCKRREPRSRSPPGQASSPTRALIRSWGAIRPWRRWCAPRLISKEQARMVASAGGLVGVWTHLADTPLEYARNVRALVDVIGVDHVCIGTDTKLTQPSPRPNGPLPADLIAVGLVRAVLPRSTACARRGTHQSGMAG